MTENNQLPLNLGNFRPEFLAWASDNQHIVKRFITEANRIWNKGRRHYSAYTIVEYIRHETALYEQDSDFKINNNFRPDLARLYLHHYPDRAELFELRVLRKRTQELAA